jgi:hypothetical protein
LAEASDKELLLVEWHEEEELLIDEVGDEGEKVEHTDQEDVLDAHVSFTEPDGFNAEPLDAE